MRLLEGLFRSREPPMVDLCIWCTSVLLGTAPVFLVMYNFSSRLIAFYIKVTSFTYPNLLLDHVTITAISCYIGHTQSQPCLTRPPSSLQRLGASRETCPCQFGELSANASQSRAPAFRQAEKWGFSWVFL